MPLYPALGTKETLSMRRALTVVEVALTLYQTLSLVMAVPTAVALRP